MLQIYRVLISIIILVVSRDAFAGKTDFRVFELKKTIPLTEKESVYYDYYVSIGEKDGVKAGDTLTVFRRVPIVDNYSTVEHNDMQVAVAQLKVIYSQKTMSIGRMIKNKRPDNMPVLEYEKVMLGDRVERGEPDPAPTLAKVMAPRNEVKRNLETKPVALVKELPQKQADTREVASGEESTTETLPIQESITINGAQD